MQDPNNKAREEVKSQSVYYISQASNMDRSFRKLSSFTDFLHPIEVVKLRKSMLEQ